MSFGKGSNVTTQTSAPNPAAAAAYNDVLNRAQGVSQTPYTSYEGELVAPVNAQQNLGIGNINANAGFAAPYIGQAAQYANDAANPITASQIAQYQSPYTQQVVDATQRQFNNQNAQQQSALSGNAAAQGALGGDRAGVAAGILAGQQSLAQAPVIAGLYNQGYQNAEQMALTQQQARANAAYSIGNLGVAGQGAALQGAGAQIGAGSLEQQTQQALDAARLQQFYQAQAYPFQTTQWLAGIDTGVGSQLGGTSTTTAPPPNPFASMLGLGLAGAGVAGGLGWKPFAATGGRIHRDAGGGLGAAPYGAASGWVPTINITGGAGAPKPPSSPNSQAQQSGGLGGINGLSGLWKSSSPATSAVAPEEAGAAGVAGDASAGVAGDASAAAGAGADAAAGIGADAAAGAGAEAAGFSIMDILPFLALLRDGGRVAPSGGLGHAAPYRSGGAVRHFEDGGLALAGYGTGSVLPFEDRWSPVPQAVREGVIDPQGMNATAFSDEAHTVPVPRVRPTGLGDAVALPPEITTGASAPALQPEEGDSGVLAYGPGAANLGTAPQPEEAPAQSGLGRFLGNPDINQALIAAGLGMMASRSPFLGQAIGEGGLQGLNAYSGAQEQRRKEQKTEADIQHGKDQLAQAAKLAQDRLTAEQGHWKQQATHQEAVLEEQKRQHQMALRTPVTIDYDPRTGNPIMGFPQINKDGQLEYRLKDGTIVNPSAGTGAPAPTAPGPMSAIPSSPANAAQPVRTASLDVGTATDAPKPGEGVAQYNTRIVQAGPYDYGADAPYIEKGMEVPEPAPLAGRSVQALKTDAENYLTTSKLPPVVRGNSPVARVQQSYQNAVKNYAGALAQSRGMTPAEVAEGWRTAPGMLRFVLGADGRATVSLGTAVRHLDTMQQLTDAWEKGSTIGDWRTWNAVTSGARREFGDASVTNLQAAAKIIGPEVIKAIGVAGAGGEREREAMETIFSPRSTPGEIKGAIGTLQTLLGGQLEGRKRQAENAGVSETRFKSLIGDRPYEILTHTDKGGGAATTPAALPTIKSKAEYDALKPDTTFIDQNGKQWSKP